MSERGSEGGGATPAPAGGAPGAGGAGGAGVCHPRSFKLRFAAQREPGRSNVSPVKPLGLPATVSGKFYSRGEAPSAAEAEGEERALRRIRRLFAWGPRAQAAPRTSAQAVGWWAAGAAPASRDPRLDHRIRDSAWLKARLAVLAADARLKRP